MRKFILAATLAASIAPIVAEAQTYYPDRWRAQHRMDWRRYRNYDYNRADPAYGGYYAERYYRDSRYYQPRYLSYNDRVYRGNDGRYYCRRNDGTTGLIIGGITGALIGKSLDRGRSDIVGTLLGAGAGAAIGSSIERSNSRVRCR